MHFAGHSDKQSLQTDDERVYSQHIANILNTWTIPPSLIFLNGCHNAEQVQLFLDAGVALVIATHRLIDDQQAAQFAREFYHSLFAQNGESSLQQAFDRAGEKVFMGQASQPRSFDLGELEQADDDTKWDWGLFPQNPEHLQQWTIRHLLESNRPVFDQHGELLNPYKGLESFKEEDKVWFFGREVLSKELSEQIPASRFFVLLGASGSGKSSLINAGVVPCLRVHNELLILQTRPSQEPFSELASIIAQQLYPDSTVKRLNEQKAFAEQLQSQQLSLSELTDELFRHSNKSQLLLCIDQFEELFTHSKSNIVQAYLDQLIQLIDSNSHVSLLLIMRADFLGSALGYPQFAEKLDKYPDKKLAVMAKAELREAIENPANKQHIQLEPALTQALLDDVENQAGSLPLLQYVLSLLWDKRKNSTIKLADYNAFGGLEKALESRADAIYQSFSSAEQQQYCKQIFLRLVQPGEGTEDTRRRANLDEFKDKPDSKAIIKALADARLITTQQSADTAYAEVSHEALIRHWGKLREWIEENREQIRTRNQISADAKQWEKHQYNPDWLRSGTPLSIAEDWLNKYQSDANELETKYIQAGIEARDKQRKEKEEQQRREQQLIQDRQKAIEDREVEQQIAAKRIRKRTIILSVIAVVMIAAAVLAWNYYQQAGIAQQETEQAKQEIEKKRLDINYNKAKVFEQKIKLAIAEGDKDKSIDNYRKAWLYGLEAEIIKIPKGKKALQQTSLNRLTDFSVNALNPEKKSPTPPLNIGSGINILIYSPNGSVLASGSNDRMIRLWDAKTGELNQVLKGHENAISALSYSPDGSVLASGSYDPVSLEGRVKLWDTKTGELKQTLKGNKSAILALSYSPDGSVLAIGLSDNTIKLWDTKIDKFRKILKGHKGIIYTLSYNIDGTVLASGSDDQTIKLWDTRTGELKQTLKGHEYGIKVLSYSPDGSVIASGSFDTTIKLWDAKTGKLKQTLKGHRGSIYALDYNPDGSALTSGSDDRLIKIWDTKTGKLEQTLKGHEKPIYALNYSPDGSVLASGSYDNTIKLWDIKKGKLQGNKNWINTIEHHSDGDVIVFVSLDQRLPQNGIKLWDANLGQLKQTLKGHEAWVNALIYSPDGNVLASASYDKTIKLWDAKTGKLKQRLEGNEDWVRALSYSPDGAVLASVSWGQIKLWDAKTGKLKRTLKGHKEKIFSLIYNPSGSVLASGSFDNTIKLWDTKTGKLKQTLKGHDGTIFALSYRPDGLVLASGSDDNTIKLWDAKTGQLKQTLKGHEDSVNALIYSPDGNVLASASDDKTIKLWDAKTGQLKQTLKGHKDKVEALSYSTGGNVLASGSSDQTIKLWDVNTGQLKQTLKGYESWVNALSYSPDGSVLASGSGDKTIKLWDKYALMTQDLFYKYDPKQVLVALKFLWKMGLDEDTLEIVHKVRTPALYPNKQGYYYSHDMDKFMPLLEMPKEGEVKADQLIQWLKDQCAYINPDEKAACQTHQQQAKGEAHAS